MEAYVVERPLGAGNYGEVLLVRHHQSGQLFVCKKINLANKSPQQRKEAENEVRTMAKVRHPNIIGFIEAFVEKQVLHIIMEYADGSDLEKVMLEHVRQNKVLEEDLIISIFVQIALALRQLHKQHLLHRDLKAANVFLTSSGEVKLGDFGFSKQLTYTMALASTICGTPYYFSPEMCQKLPYNNKSDVWSLGVILYELISLRKPFDAKSLPELRTCVITKEPAAFTTSHVSEDLRQLCLSMLRKSSSTRPSVGMILQASIVRSQLCKMAANYSQTQAEASRVVQRLKTQHPPDSTLSTSNQRNTFSTPPLQQHAVLATGRWNPRDMAKLLTTGDVSALSPSPSSVVASFESPQRLHSSDIPDSRSQVSSAAPVSVVAELSDATVREERSKYMKHEMETILSCNEPNENDVFEAIGEPQTDEEASLRAALGDTLFMKAIQILMLIEHGGTNHANEKHYTELVQLLGEKMYLIGQLQRVSALFEAEELP